MELLPRLLSTGRLPFTTAPRFDILTVPDMSARALTLRATLDFSATPSHMEMSCSHPAPLAQAAAGTCVGGTGHAPHTWLSWGL